MYRFAIALRYLRSRKITYLSVIGVAVGVAALIIVMAVMEGFEEDFKDRIRGMLSDVVVRYRGEKSFEEVEKSILSVEHVTAAAPRLRGMALVMGPGGRGAVEIVGIDVSKEVRVSKLAEYIINSRVTGMAKDLAQAIEALEMHFSFRTAELARLGLLPGKAGERLKPLHESLREVKSRLSKEGSPDLIGGQIRDAEQCFKTWLGDTSSAIAAPDARSALSGLEEGMETFFRARRAEFEETRRRAEADLARFESGGGFDSPFNEPLEGRELVMGEELLPHLRVARGDRVRLYTAGSKGLSSVEDEEDLAKSEFTVAGTFRSRMYKSDSKIVFMPIRTAQILQAKEGMISEIGVKVDDQRNAEAVKRAIKEVLPGADAQTWAEKRRSLIAAINLEKGFLSAVLFMIIVVAAFNMLGTFVMMVTEKTRDLGILKSLGGSTAGIASIFFLCGVFVATAGSAIGAAAGLLFVDNINEIEGAVHSLTGITPFPRDVYYLDSIPTIVNPADVFWIVFPTVAVSVLLGSVFPAIKAAMLGTEHALRYE